MKEQKWNFLYIQDLVQAIIALCGCPEISYGVVNIAGDETRPLREYVDMIWRLCGERGIPLYGAVGDRLERHYGIMPVNQKLRQLTGWTQQTTFEAGIGEMLVVRRGLNPAMRKDRECL